MQNGAKYFLGLLSGEMDYIGYFKTVLKDRTVYTHCNTDIDRTGPEAFGPVLIISKVLQRSQPASLLRYP